jgi:hypothetical protein
MWKLVERWMLMGFSLELFGLGKVIWFFPYYRPYFREYMFEIICQEKEKYSLCCLVFCTFSIIAHSLYLVKGVGFPTDISNFGYFNYDLDSS